MAQNAWANALTETRSPEESREALRFARRREDQRALRSAQRAKENAPELKASPSKTVATLEDLLRGGSRAVFEGLPFTVGNMLSDTPVPSEYDRRQGVFHEPEPTSLTEDISNMIVDPSNLVLGAAGKGALKLLKGVGKAAPVVIPAATAAYAGDTESAPVQKMLQMMYRGRSSFTPVEERAMFMSPSPRYAEEYAKRRVGQIGGDKRVDSYLVDPFSVERRGHNITPEEGGNMQSIIAYPDSGEAEYKGTRKFAGGGLALLRKALTGKLARDVGTTKVIKEKGGNWLSGSVEGALSGLKKRVDPELEGYFRRGQNMTPGERAEVATKIPINDWVGKQLTRYVKNDMATPEDPVRALAERGVLHFDPTSIRESVAQVHPSGEEIKKLGQSEAAQGWENLSDRFIYPNLAGNISYPKTLVENPWLESVKIKNPATPVYSRSSLANSDDLGFNHLIDELSNALNPESGLPRHLLLDPKSIERVSVPQAVQRVSDINKWRAEQKAIADQARANNAATVLHKEYPDDPRGLRWVELREPKDIKGSTQKETLAYNPSDDTEDVVTKNIPNSYQALADALKYEGDTMGHCVGGYCDDVVSGRSRIYSLRDAKGQPHVTIEVAPGQQKSFSLKNDYDRLTPEEKARFDATEDLKKWNYPAELGLLDEARLSELSKSPDKIVQIKGKGNAKPIDEYLPFVQDFVRSGQWSDVGELQNAGLTKHPTGKYVSDAEANALVQRHFGDVSMGNKPDDIETPWQYANRIRRYDSDMLSDTDRAFLADWDAGNFAQGGGVNLAGGGLALLRKALTGQLARKAGTTSVVKEKGGNWLSGSVEGALSGLKSPYVKGYQEAVERYGPETAHQYAARPPVGAGALNNFIDKQLTRYVKNDMATPEDPVRALAERGILHVDPDAQYWSNNFVHSFGAHLEKLATAPLAQRWENATDNMLRAPSADNLIKERSVHGVDDWVKNVPRETPIHYPKDNTIATNLGFNHLIDELSNAINPESGLPRHLQFPADRLDKVSVPQAVERVAQINAWRAAQKAEADALKANNAATVLHKEYPEKGMKWVELKKPTELPEGWQEVRKPSGEVGAYYDPHGATVYDHPGAQALEDALKYEGDTMGHCVGGYCEDVASGRSRIYSLRDAKGQPHVTIEVQPKGVVFSDVAKYLGEDKANELLDQGVGLKEMIAMIPDFKRPESIIQIKGKQNKAPNPEYLPFVQDFVKSGQWSDVGDLQNTGLMKNKFDLETLARYGKEYKPYVNQQELDDIMSSIDAAEKGTQNFAQGGAAQSTPSWNIFNN